MYQRYQNREAETICIRAMADVLAHRHGMWQAQSSTARTGLYDRRIVGIERAQQIVVGLRRIEPPQRSQLGDRRVVPVHAQIDQRKALALHHLKMRTSHRD